MTEWHKTIFHPSQLHSTTIIARFFKPKPTIFAHLDLSSLFSSSYEKTSKKCRAIIDMLVYCIGCIVLLFCLHDLEIKMSS